MNTPTRLPESIDSLWRSARRFARRLGEAAQAPVRHADPIDHPDIAAMDLRQLADLPLRPPSPRAEVERRPSAIRPPARAA